MSSKLHVNEIESADTLTIKNDVTIEGSLTLNETPNNYTTEETETGQQWIDGKKVYRKVFTGITNSSESENILSGVAVDTVVRMDLRIKNQSNNWIGNESNQYTQGGITQIGIVYQSNDTFSIYHGYSYLQSKPYIIIFEYTKV